MNEQQQRFFGYPENFTLDQVIDNSPKILLKRINHLNHIKILLKLINHLKMIIKRIKHQKILKKNNVII